MAKGLEDTALYRDVALLARNDVGMHPAAEPISVDGFHERQRARARRWPDAILATSTHDTKRGEDARTRLAVLSELADEWLERLERWSADNAAARSNVGGRPVPGIREEWLLYQSLVGVWPADGDAERAEVVERIVAYMRKAVREAKLETSWLEPNEEHEAAVERFVRQVLSPSSAFRVDLARFAQRVARLGVAGSLSQLVLKCTSPGVPDVYQGSELWDLSLVDPDNRRPVDFAERGRLLEGLEGRDPAELLDGWPDGSIKLFVLRALLRLRRERPEAFAGGYRPLAVTGARAANVVAFTRGSGRRVVVAVVSRLTARQDGWGDTACELPRRPMRDILTGRSFGTDGASRLDELLAVLPAAVLVPSR
jgi:(1->4)-alpha-D-glucan 1-alpha-D-glucosylmutase